MTWREFVAAVVGHLAWPGVVLVLGFAFRAEVRGFLRDLDEVTGRGLTFKRRWRDSERQVQRALAVAGPESDGSQVVALPDSAAAEPEGSASDRLAYERYQAATNPPGAIDAAWRRLAARLGELVEGEGSTAAITGRGDPVQLARQARELGLVSAEFVDSIGGLDVMYRLATQAPERVALKQAQEFQTLVDAQLWTVRHAGSPR
jgi:hypothetical protein